MTSILQFLPPLVYLPFISMLQQTLVGGYFNYYIKIDKITQTIALIEN